MHKLTALTLFVLLLAPGLFGQATTQLTGTVTDPTGAVIPGATLTLESVEKGVKRETTSDAAGRYAFLQVPPDMYRVLAKASGFSDVVVNEVRLLVNTPATINIQFEKVGAVAETISVSAETIQVNTTDATMGNAIGTKPILQLPLNARNIVGLLALQPGVVYTNDEDTTSRNGAVNGGKSDQANVTLDGVDVNDQMDRQAFTSVLRVTPDSVQEFRTTTLNANADQGRTSGAQVALITKSGTNDLHGSVYEYHRNTVTTANGFFLNQLTPNPVTGKADRPKLIRNIFGASAGGPLKKNRMFLFGNYEGRRDAKDGQATRTVPSMDLRQGIINYKRKDGSIAKITPSELAAKLDPRGANAAALKVMQAYPAPNDFSLGDGMNFQGYRFTAPTPLRWNTYIAKLDYVIDEAAKHTVFVRGNLQNDNEKDVPQFPGQQPNSVNLKNNKGIGTGLTSLLRPTLISNFRYGLTRQGTESTGVGHFNRVGLRGMDFPVGSTTGFVAIIPAHTISEDLTWTKGSHTLQFGGVGRFIRNRRSSYASSFHTATANASWLVDSGAELNRPWQDLDLGGLTYFKYAITDVMGLVTQGDSYYNYKVDGSVIAPGSPVRRNFASNEYEFYAQDTWKVTRGLTVTAGLRYSLMPPIYEANGEQVSPNVRIGDWFNLRGALAQQGKSQMEAGRISFVPRDKGGRPLYDYHKKNFAPRLAVAYSPQGSDGLSKFLFGGPGKTSIRAGWGMYYDLFGSGLMRAFDSVAFGLSTHLTNPSATLTVANAPRYTGFDQIPAGLLLPAPEAKFPATFPDSFAITHGLDDTIRPPYNMSANFSIGREFAGGWFVQMAYAGRFSRRSLIRRDAAMPTDLKDPKSGMTYFEAGSILARQVLADVPIASVQKVPFFENLWSKSATSTLTATQVAYRRFYNNMYDWTYALYQLDTPNGNCVGGARCSDLGPWAFYHPQYSYLSVFSSIGGGNYHGGQLNVRKRFSNGDSFDINYTYSKSIDLRSNTERVSYSTGVLWNPWQPGLMKGVSDYDNTHLFSMLGVYNLPIGRGQKIAGGVGRAVDAIIGGWQLGGVWRWSSGFPVSVYETGVWPTNWNNNNWALWNGKPVTTKRTKNAPGIDGVGGANMFPDPSKAVEAFDWELPGGIGTRNGLRGDGIFNIDTSVSKRFTMPYSEKHSLQFRWEVFNLTNTPRFDVDTVSLDIAVTGTFGKYSDELSVPRVMQFGLRYEF